MPAPYTPTAKQPASAVTVGTSDTSLIAANGGRVAAYICNTHAVNDVYLALGGTAASGQGIYLRAGGGSVVIDNFHGEIRAIATGASTVVTFSEV